MQDGAASGMDVGAMLCNPFPCLVQVLHALVYLHGQGRIHVSPLHCLAGKAFIDAIKPFAAGAARPGVPARAGAHSPRHQGSQHPAGGGRPRQGLRLWRVGAAQVGNFLGMGAAAV